MAQFDVFVSPGRRQSIIPFVVSLQNARYDRAATRLVAGLVLEGALRPEALWLAPAFLVSGRVVVLDIFSLTTIALSRLGLPIARLDDEESRAKLVRAMDEFLSQA